MIPLLHHSLFSLAPSNDSIYLCTMSNIVRHNLDMVTTAQYRASTMEMWPSPLEEKMRSFLDKNGIVYETQKIFYIHADDGWIIRYYIADFFIPRKNIIIEVDGKFHDEHRQHDKKRTKDIQEEYPNIEVLRYKWKDLSDSKIMFDLLSKIK